MAEAERVPTTDQSTDPLAWLSDLEGVPSGLAAARDGIDAMLRDRGLRKTSPAQTGESLLRGAHASAVLEGSASSLDDVRAGDGDEIASAALRVSTGMLALVPVISSSPRQAFARLHALAGKGDVEDDSLGRPVNAEGAERLNALSETLIATKAPALMVAALAHADLITVAPFASYNGLVARAVERLILVARGVDPASVVVPEAGHLELRAQYESNLRGYRDGGRSGLHAWLLYSGEAITKAVEASPLRD